MRFYPANEDSVDIRLLLRALPTKDNICTMLANLEETHQSETQQLRSEITVVHAKVEVVEK